MSNTILMASLAILVIAVLAGWHYRVQILDFLCGTTPPAPTEHLKAALDNQAMLLDMRMYVETRKEGADLIPGAKNIPLLRLRWHYDELPKDKTLITFCVSGKRAGKGADMLNARGFKALSGGGISNVKAILASN
ncbi:MAG: hypothetical protein P8Z78_14955 [Gammaproteobacteria bacterium]